MAGTSPRRSSRARVSQPPHSTSNNGSTTSSTSSNRGERNTRAGNKASSPRKSTPSGSLSSEGHDESIATTVEDSGQSRRKKRGQAEETQKAAKQQTIEMPSTTEDIAEDDEAVRCVCGFDDYPGPPPPSEEDSKYGIKENNHDAPITDAELTDDLAGFFLQCDVCKVWQHGACVGIKNETTAPEEYFCEICRKDLHKLSAASNGQRYSQYLPLYQAQSRTSSRAGSFSKDGTRSPRGGSKSGRPSSAVQSAKRRSTMNSRDAAYDEEEQLRQAIEASKGEDISESVDGGTRHGKRGRSDSEEKPGSTKRQRTSSNSSSPPRNQPRFPSQNDDDETHNSRTGGQKKIRGAAARNHKEKLDREEREKMRKEAANNRQSRLERRKVDEMTEENPPTSSRAAKSSKLSSEPQETTTAKTTAAESPPAVQPPPVSHKKGGRPPNSRKGKLGRNQYSKDKEQRENNDTSPGRSQSRDAFRHDESAQSNNQRGNNSHSTTDNKISKSKSLINSKITWPEMRKRVDGYLNFISQTQIEMAQDPTFFKKSSGSEGGAVKEMLKDLAEGFDAVRGGNGSVGEGGKEFKDLSVLEMMDCLTREMIKWQKDFAG